MGWNPFIPDRQHDMAMRAAMAEHNSAPQRKRRQEDFIALGLPVLLMIGVAALLNAHEFAGFWKGNAALSSALTVFAAACAVASFALLIRLALRRYRPEPESFAPAWFRLALACCELTGAAGLLLFLVSVCGVNFTFSGATILLVFPLVMAGAWISGAVLRWRGEPYGWTAGRLFDPKMF
jgi:hypothetical protein